jgi:hypothetical protein
MRILAYEECRDCFTGVLEAGEAYWTFQLTADDRLDLEHEYPKENYRDLEHFQGVMGKFEPYVFFLTEPLKVDPLTYEALKQAAEEHRRKYPPGAAET